MRAAFVSAVALALLPSTFASPFNGERRNWSQKQHKTCDLGHLELELPENQTTLAVPPNTVPRFVTIGIGNQNYTCSKDGNYTSVGAIAELYDLSCIIKEKNIDLFKRDGNQEKFHLQFHSDITFGHQKDILKLLGEHPVKAGDHYFIKNPVTGEGITPVFDFRTGLLKGNPNGFIANKTPPKSIPSPEGPDNVAWLLLDFLQGEAAKFTFRVETTGGQPPKTCEQGSPDISVGYTAQYWFFADKY